jgi:hypothetical protein
MGALSLHSKISDHYLRKLITSLYLDLTSSVEKLLSKAISRTAIIKPWWRNWSYFTEIQLNVFRNY